VPAPRRKPLSRAARSAVLAKTDGRCHVCGGELGVDWKADHVWAHASGGAHKRDNYLAACASCNRWRWHYGPEKIRQILELGVYARSELGRRLAKPPGLPPSRICPPAERTKT
jgi:5-methylcytosine-specific restriction endonuclease McrA